MRRWEPPQDALQANREQTRLFMKSHAIRPVGIIASTFLAIAGIALTQDMFSNPNDAAYVGVGIMVATMGLTEVYCSVLMQRAKRCGETFDEAIGYTPKRASSYESN